MLARDEIDFARPKLLVDRPRGGPLDPLLAHRPRSWVMLLS